MICSMAAFNEHCALTFWNAAEVVGEEAEEGAMGQFGRITEAKRESTRERRLARAVEWLAEGKPRNWKYM